MIDLNRALRFLDCFSVITVGENKVPNFPWKKFQTEKNSTKKFIENYNYKGGIIKNDGQEIPATTNIGLVTGYDFLEVIDVDLKVFSTPSEMKSFWDEFIETLRENIFDFDKKFVVYKTKSGGYHILYKSKRITNNKKIARLEGHKEAVIESRGRFGYVFLYPENKVGSLSYFEIDFVSDNDREILWQICKSYNHIEVKPEEPKKEKKEYNESDVTPWTDFNEKTDIWDVISDEFTIPPRGIKNKHILVKRHGSSTPHSGYIFKDTNCLYLFSTGTIYPHEKLISPFTAYAYKYHNGDFKEATKDLYEQGFGSRLSKKIDEIRPEIPKEVLKIETVDFPVDVFHPDLQFYINECSRKLDSNIDFMGASLLWLISVCVGNSFEIEVKRGWKENGVVWVAVVGKAGLGKTPSISNIIAPLMKSNSKEIKKFITENEKYNHYQSLSKKEKEEYPEVYKPKKTQFIANDITLEALVELHQESDNSLGVFKDELAGWLKDMNKYRAGSDLEFWLSCWSGKSVSMNRRSVQSSFVEKPFISVLGGIQPSIFNSFATEENKENGFMDRMLLSFPDAKIDEYNESELDYTTIKWYSEVIIKLYETFKKYINRDEDGEIVPRVCRFSPEAKKEWVRIFNEITSHQNNEDENEYLKSMYPKQKSYIPRFALLLHCLDCYFDETKATDLVGVDSVLKAEKLSKYFVNTAKKVKYESNEIKELKTASKRAETNIEKIQAIYTNDPNFNRSKVAEMLGISRQYVINVIKKIEA